MKRMFLSAVLVAAICTASFAQKVLAEGETFTTLGTYKIRIAENTVPVTGKECKAYVISYENTPMEVTVAVCKDRNCKRYVVLSDKLSVQYVCNEKYFGVERLDKKFAGDGYKTIDADLNRFEYYHQKVLTPGKRTELEATELIAAFFPRLLNEETGPVALR